MFLRDLGTVFKEWVIYAVNSVPNQRARPLGHEPIIVLGTLVKCAFGLIL